MRRKIRLSAAVFCSTLFLSLLISPVPGSGENAAKFVLRNENDELVSLSTLIRKNNIIVAFWASYCVPCKKEIPQLVELEKKYGKEKNLRLVLINIDSEGKEKAEPVLKEINVQRECLFDIYQLAVKGYAPDLKIPATFLINKNGNIVFKVTGESAENISRLEAAILRLK